MSSSFEVDSSESEGSLVSLSSWDCTTSDSDSPQRVRRRPSPSLIRSIVHRDVRIIRAVRRTTRSLVGKHYVLDDGADKIGQQTTSLAPGQAKPRLLERLRAICMLGPDDLVVDVGSGEGFAALVLAATSGCHAYGCEIVPWRFQDSVNVTKKFCSIIRESKSSLAAACGYDPDSDTARVSMLTVNEARPGARGRGAFSTPTIRSHQSSPKGAIGTSSSSPKDAGTGRVAAAQAATNPGPATLATLTVTQSCLAEGGSVECLLCAAQAFGQGFHWGPHSQHAALESAASPGPSDSIIVGGVPEFEFAGWVDGRVNVVNAALISDNAKPAASDACFAQELSMLSDHSLSCGFDTEATTMIQGSSSMHEENDAQPAEPPGAARLIESPTSHSATFTMQRLRILAPSPGSSVAVTMHPYVSASASFEPHHLWASKNATQTILGRAQVDHAMAALSNRLSPGFALLGAGRSLPHPYAPQASQPHYRGSSTSAALKSAAPIGDWGLVSDPTSRRAAGPGPGGSSPLAPSPTPSPTSARTPTAATPGPAPDCFDPGANSSVTQTSGRIVHSPAPSAPRLSPLSARSHKSARPSARPAPRSIRQPLHERLHFVRGDALLLLSCGTGLEALRRSRVVFCNNFDTKWQDDGFQTAVFRLLSRTMSKGSILVSCCRFTRGVRSDGLMDAGHAAVAADRRSTSELYRNPNLHFEVSGGWEEPQAAGTRASTASASSVSLSARSRISTTASFEFTGSATSADSSHAGSAAAYDSEGESSAEQEHFDEDEACEQVWRRGRLLPQYAALRYMIQLRAKFTAEMLEHAKIERASAGKQRVQKRVRL